MVWVRKSSSPGPIRHQVRDCSLSPGVGDLGVVDDEFVVSNPLDLQLLAPELAETVCL